MVATSVPSTLAELESYLREHGFELHVTLRERRVTVILRRLPPQASFIRGGVDLAEALTAAIAAASVN